MARRENQGLQIALIILVMLTVLLAVTTYLFYSRTRTLAVENANLKNANNDANAKVAKAEAESSDMKRFIGYSEETAVEDIEKGYQADMATYGGSLAEVEQNYRELPKQLFRGIQDRNKRISMLSEERSQLNSELESSREQFATQLADAQSKMAEMEKQLKQVESTATQERNRINQQMADLAASKDETKAELETLKTQSENEKAKLERDKANLNQIVESRNETIQNLTNENFETPDGQVKWVNAGQKLVYINIGGADGLRRQVTFNVYGADANNLAKETPKGKIEVTRIIDAHTAEARLIEEDATDPILTGDFIYTAIWDSKSGMHFALVGEMDINGDGKDDRQIVKNLIRINNGTVDAEDVEGEMVGSIQRTTRYLVTGGEVDVDLADSDDQAVVALAEKARQVRTDMENEADRLGVQVITIDKLLGFIGYTGEKRFIPLGGGATRLEAETKSQTNVTPGSAF